MLGNSDLLVLDAAHLDPRAQDYSIALEILVRVLEMILQFCLYLTPTTILLNQMFCCLGEEDSNWIPFLWLQLETPGLILYWMRQVLLVCCKAIPVMLEVDWKSTDVFGSET